jgi:hypothetical protein
MGSQPRAGGRYIIPIDSNGAPLDGTAAEGPGRGFFTLTAGATYYLIVGGDNAPIESIHLMAPAGLIITSATVQTTDQGALEATDSSSTVGEWVNEDPDDTKPFARFVAVDGTGWSATNSVVAVTGAGAGGARWNLAGWAPNRTRVAIVVGATGGPMRAAAHGKD